MDAGTDDDPTWIEGFEGGRHQRTDRREDQGGVERLRRRRERVARPFGTEPARERLFFRITRRGKGEDASTLEPGDLRDDVRRVPKAIPTHAAPPPRGPARRDSRSSQRRAAARRAGRRNSREAENKSVRQQRKT